MSIYAPNVNVNVNVSDGIGMRAAPANEIIVVFATR